MMSSREVELKELGVSYTIEDISNQPATEIYTFRGGAIHSDDRIVGTFPVSARTWRLTMHVPRSVLSKTASPALLFAGGLAASMLLGSIVYSLLKLRIGQMSNLHQTELQSTRDELIALASHQLRTPASSVRQYIGMLQQGYFGELTVEQLAIAEKAYASNDRQLEIIDQLLYVAKADAGQLILQVAPFDLANTIRDTLDAMMANASEKNIKLMVDLPRKLPIKADERFVRMIIENLVSNAIKYSYTGSEIKIRLTTTLGVAKIRVVDTGVGIADKDHDALFQKFSRIQNPLSATEGGSGLGLYLARKLAEAHGGNIVVSSRVGRGSRFTIILPLRSVPKESVIHITE
jgi:signal transduction histidine kinase